MEDDVDVELILYDVLDNIFNYLNIYDLNRAAEVCKSWYYTAKVNKFKRGPQVMILQALEDFVATKFTNLNRVNPVDEPVDDFKLSLRVKPRVGLFFTDGKYPPSADVDSVPYEICVTHQWTQLNDSSYAAIETKGINVDGNPIGGERNITAAVFFPTLPNVYYTIAEASSHRIQQHFDGSNSPLIDIVDKLFPPQVNHACFFIFIYHWQSEPTYQNKHNIFIDKILNVLQERYKPGTYCLWGGAINDIFAVANHTRLVHGFARRATSFFGMSISGPSVRSWSIVIKNNTSDADIQAKLQKFKNLLNLTSFKIAFLILPSDEIIDQTKISIFKSFLPSVTLISIFNDKNQNVYSINSMSNETKLKHTNSYAYMVLSYKL